MRKVLFVHNHQDKDAVATILKGLKASESVCKVTEVQGLDGSETALREKYDAVAIFVDSMSATQDIVRIVAVHESTKDALVSTWCPGCLSHRGGMSMTTKPEEIPKQLLDMAKTKKEAG
jgi:hypothetical protein